MATVALLWNSKSQGVGDSFIFPQKIPFFGTSFLFLDILSQSTTVVKATFLLLQVGSQRHFGPELKWR